MQDPVCGMTVDPHKAAGTEVYNGVTYAFCSPHCLEKFPLTDAVCRASPPDPWGRTCGRDGVHAPCTLRCARTGRAPAPAVAWPLNL